MKRDYVALLQALDPLRRLVIEVQASAGLHCPNPGCDNQGFTPRQVADDEWEQEQCEFCYTVADSVFNRNAAQTSLARDPDKQNTDR